MRLIDADALIEKLGISEKCDCCQYNSMDDCEKGLDFVEVCCEIYNAPTVEPHIPLKSCPICGCKAELIEKKIYGVTCLNYSCNKPYVEFYESKEQAIKMWNKGERYKGE